MPYKKSKYSKRAKRAKPGSRYTNYFNAGYQLVQDVKKLKNLINTEHKVYEVEGLTNVANNGTLINLCAPAQGLSDNQRSGDSIKCQDFTIRAKWEDNAASAVVRMIVFEDKQNKVSSASDLLDNASSGGVVYSPKLYDNRFETKILYDRTWKLIPSSDASIQLVDQTLHLGHHTQFSNATTTIVTGAYKMLLLSDRSTSTPAFQYHGRASYTDN